MGIWVDDGSGHGSVPLVSPVTFSGPIDLAHVAWAADHLLHAITANSHVSIAMRVLGQADEGIVATGAYPAATSDGRTIVFVGLVDNDKGLWKADDDGRHTVPLLSGQVFSPMVTADNRQVVFISNRTGAQMPWIMSIEGGTPTPVATMFANYLDVSHDGRLVFGSVDEQNRPTMVVCDLPTCTTRKIHMAPPSIRSVRWMPDGRGVAYIDAATESNLWEQPLDGSSSHQLTHFTDETITDFAWSRDGQRLAISRATITNDIVLFKGLRR